MEPYNFITYALKFIIICALLFSSSCLHEENSVNTAYQEILGKWEETEIGNWPDMKTVPLPPGFWEFLDNGYIREFDYNTGTNFYKKYWIDSLLHIAMVQQDGFLQTVNYKYEFFDAYLRLDRQEITNNYTSVYKQIE